MKIELKRWEESVDLTMRIIRRGEKPVTVTFTRDQVRTIQRMLRASKQPGVYSFSLDIETSKETSDGNPSGDQGKD